MLKGRHIALTELRSEDSPRLFGWINDPKTVRFNAPYKPVHAASHAKWFENVLGDPKRIIFAIRNPKGGLLGFVQLIDVDPIHRSAELTIRIGADKNRNHGAGSEAVKLIVDFAFRDCNLQRVLAARIRDQQARNPSLRKGRPEKGRDLATGPVHRWPVGR